jgi:hypothetical protein
MSEFWKTISFVGVALVLTGAAFVSTRDRTRLNDTFNDQGKPFFPDFKDPLACTDLEVVDFEPSTATATRFRVMFKDKKWVIPSHHNYPADARDRLSKTAAAVMDLVKDTIRSDGLEDTQERMGVIDPLDSKVGALKGRGKRVTLRDASEKVLADFVIGNEIKGNERKEGSGGQRYVRVPGQKRIYGVNVKADLSTRFADWIETNLLKVDATKVRRIVFDNYKLQEAGDGRGMVLQRGEKLTIERKDSSGPWTMEGGLPADQELNEEKLRGLTDALGDLKIVGVRPKPPGLKDPNQPEMKLTMPIVASLASKGFILAKQGLFSEQGDVIVTTDEGVVYTLRYGGPVFGTGEELTAGQADDVEKQREEPKKDAAKKSEGTQENRYLMVTVSFDPSLIPKPKSLEPKPAIKTDALVNIPSNAFAPNPNDPKYVAEQKEAEDKAKQEQADYDKKIADGEKRVKELVDRFGPWYYVTTGDSFRAINLDRMMLVQPKKAAGTTGDSPAGLPGPLPPGGRGGFTPAPR